MQEFVFGLIDRAHTQTRGFLAVVLALVVIRLVFGELPDVSALLGAL